MPQPSAGRMPRSRGQAPDSPRIRRRARKLWLGALAFLLLLLVCADVLVGPAAADAGALARALWRAPQADPTLSVIIWHIRLPQALMAAAVGAALGHAGAEMQTVLNNPLASPFTLGISSAAALGAALPLVLGISLPGVAAQYMLVANALVFALLCAWLLDVVARRARIGAPGLILFGIALVFTFNALLSLIQIAASAAALQDLVFWMMGSLARSDWPRLAAMSVVLALVAAHAWRQSWALTALRFGDERATGFGVDPRRQRRAALLRIGVLAALAVALTGVIGFVGLVAPHIARRLWGEDHRWYLPASALAGGIMLAAASLVSRLISSSVVLPVGLVTTLVGIPFFLAALLRRRVLQ